MTKLAAILDLLHERSPRSPHELAAAVDCPPLEIYATLNEATWSVERCAPPVCIAADPLCPCQDGAACHYRDLGDTKAMPLPAGWVPAPNVWWFRVTTHELARRRAAVEAEAKQAAKAEA